MISDSDRDGSCNPEYKRHESLYIDDHSVVFLVEDALYKVHCHFFKRHSSVFATMFSLPPGNGNSIEGLSDDHPIKLEGVRKIDFERMLSLFYPQDIVKGDLVTVEEWTSVLALASKWLFPVHRQLAIDRLSQIASPIDRILLSRRYDVTSWLVPAYFDLCTREAPLNYEEGEMLGMKDVILIGQLRHSIRVSTRVSMQDKNVIATIQRMLNVSE
ncbi:hypothetical protein WOLCODRAFT_160719 [Wolfiporia cocos MD-104 SS10]|uniref:BTB domain-containing protein n=1 Tax=Wolfiporia cocos (strain MD-104) TaxID=742152 RepID=A0A2H3IWY5_WOLCO|nr:hypothetical protein WOLCODRAFT_160719 [Wolfiporia cocos MD-104 SS10]